MLASCASPAPSVEIDRCKYFAASAMSPDAGTQALFDQILARAQRELLSQEPEQATLLGFSPDDAGPDANSRLGDYGLEGRAQRRKRLLGLIDALKAVPEAGLDPQRALTRAVAIERAQGWLDLENAAGIGGLSPWGVIWGFELYPVNQISGLHIGAPSLLINSHPLQNEADAQAYLARVEALGGALDKVIEEVRRDADIRPPPRIAVQGAIEVVEGFLAPASAEHPLIASFRARLEAGQIRGREAIATSVQRALEERVYPAYRRLRAELANILPRASDHLGLAHVPNGREIYRLALFMHADTRLPPGDIHRIGLDETRRLSTELDAQLKLYGLREGSVQDRLSQLTLSPNQLYDDSDAGREQLLEDLRQRVSEVDARLGEIFPAGPKRPAEIRRIPQFLERYASGGGGQPPSIDGKSPGVFVINLKDMRDVPKWSLAPLTYHEASPGHIFEGEIAMSGGLPAARLFLARSNAFAEGWAMYSEQLAGEMGLYQAIQGGEIGRLRSELYRAVRLVVDTGIHDSGWTFDEAVAFMVASGAVTESEARREVVRYAVWPGQAVGYKLGMIELLAARERAKAALGDTFDLKAFHERVLSSGGLPIPWLTAAVDCWSGVETQGHQE